MNKRLRALIVVLMIGGSLAARAVAQPDAARDLVKGEKGRAILTWLEAAESKGFSGAVLAAIKGKLVAAVGIAHADLNKKVKITPATLFEVASFTKQFTGAAAVRLAEQGRLKLDDPINKHLPGVPVSCAAITLRQLLQHTSGIPGSNSRGAGDDLAAVLPVFLAGGPLHDPGTHWEYWNQGYALATEVIARAAKTSFVDYCQRELFRRAKMKSSCFTGAKAPARSTVAVGRSKNGGPRSALAHPYGNSYGFQYRGMGGAVTNVWDLWRWDRALAGKILNEESKAELFKPGLNDYALGWFVKRERGRLVQSHGGSVRGFVCMGRRYPQHDACVFVLSNDDSTPVRVVATAIEQMLFGEDVTVTYPGGADAAAGAFLVGEYSNAEGSKLKIMIVGNAIRAQVDWAGRDNVSRMTIAKDQSGQFAVFVNADRYDLKITEKSGGKAKVLGLWGRTFRRQPR